MDSIGKVVIDSQAYYSADDIKSKARVFAGSARNSREIVRQRKIPYDAYIYVRKQPGSTTYKKTDGSASQDRVYFAEAFTKTIAELNPQVTQVQVAASTARVAKATSEETIEQEKPPDIIELDDDEKFHDDEGNVLEIETRGDRTYDGVFFRVKDVSSGFGLESLKIVLTKPDSGYRRNVDYKAFACRELTNGYPTTTSTASARKYLFLTYQGLMRVLFTKGNSKTDQFQKWAIETLFTVHMGDAASKNKLASKITGVPYESIQQFFSASATPLPCIYLIHLNDVKTLRSHMNIPHTYADDMIVFKYGQTKDFEDRKNGHRQMFKSINNYIDMKLVQFSYIDPKYVFKAETALKQLVSPHMYIWQMPHKSCDEIVIVSKKELAKVRDNYKTIGTQFSGHSDQINKVIQQQTHQMDVMTERADGKDMVVHELRERLQDKDDMITMLKNEVARLRADEEPKQKNKNASS